MASRNDAPQLGAGCRARIWPAAEFGRIRGAAAERQSGRQRANSAGRVHDPGRQRRHDRLRDSPATTLKQDTDTQLPRKDLSDALEIHCPAATRISLTVSDNRQDSAGGNTAYTNNLSSDWYAAPRKGAGLGRDSDGNKIGAYAAAIGQWKADGKPVSGADAHEEIHGMWGGYGGLPGSTAGAYDMPASVTFVFATTAGEPATIVTAKDYSLSLSVAANIAPAKTLTLDRPVRLDGSMLFTLNYL
ncbi:DUF1120 domain-containing protein [Burkholderia ubonensis]|uniref:DUF1120 domain-containing protein n=1 Tax=Burkholderia ubonensis TaxID=101571 RepID=UPI0009B32BC6|nr:DUF1120 domain-containing protein [Burkholderia ubonensis]